MTNVEETSQFDYEPTNAYGTMSFADTQKTAVLLFQTHYDHEEDK
jgi:hypothetical protein